jgi:hypothetical protein
MNQSIEDASRKELHDALVALENACDERNKCLSTQAYLMAEECPGMRDALYTLDDARSNARRAIANYREARQSSQSEPGAWSEETMKQWDYWRKQIAEGDKSSAPRDWFECLAAPQQAIPSGWTSADIDDTNCKTETLEQFCRDNIRLAPFFAMLANALSASPTAPIESDK